MTALREPLIKQAVNFMSNAGLKSTPWEKKQSFLEGKGLTAEEIAEARRRFEEQEANPASTPSSRSIGAAPRGSTGPSTAISSSSSSAVSALHSNSATGSITAAPAQAILLLRRRLAELDHERACYIDALSALGDLPGSTSIPPSSSTDLPALSASMHSAPPSASPPSTGSSLSSSEEQSAGKVAAAAMANSREPLIKQAETFLSNPAMASKTWEQKTEFLKGKGLTDAEIEEARRRSEGKAAPKGEVNPTPTSPPASASPSSQLPIKKPWETNSPKVPLTPSPSTPELKEPLAEPLPDDALRDDDPDLMEILPPTKPDSK